MARIIHANEWEKILCAPGEHGAALSLIGAIEALLAGVFEFMAASSNWRWKTPDDAAQVVSGFSP
jgi:hypothetical protein